jgi:hypothetical protein
MAKAIDELFVKEQDIAVHLKQLGVILLDISDSVKDKALFFLTFQIQ